MVSQVLFSPILLAFSIKINGYFGIFFYSLILKQKFIFWRSKQEAFLVKKLGDFKRQPGFDPITFTFSENSNYVQESLLKV